MRITHIFIQAELTRRTVTADVPLVHWWDFQSRLFAMFSKSEKTRKLNLYFEVVYHPHFDAAGMLRKAK